MSAVLSAVPALRARTPQSSADNISNVYARSGHAIVAYANEASSSAPPLRCKCRSLPLDAIGTELAVWAMTHRAECVVMPHSGMTERLLVNQ